LPCLLTVAGSAARNEWRSRRRRRGLLGRIGPPGPAPDHADDVAGRVDDERRMAELLAAARRLPPAEAEALALCIWSGVAYAEAAEVLGISESSVRSRVSRAKSRLTSFIAQQAAAPMSLETP
jgi:RNA polymerase sigma factor (sigma-70 family)